MFIKDNAKEYIQGRGYYSEVFGRPEYNSGPNKEK